MPRQSTGQFRSICLCLLISMAVVYVPSTLPAQSTQSPHEIASGLSAKAAKNLVERRSYENAYNSYVNGLLSEGLGDHYHAAQAFRKAWEFFPESFELGYSLANSYLKLREPEMALEITKKLIPRNVDAYKLSAVCYQLLGDVNAMRSSYYSVLKLDPDDLSIYRVLAKMFQQTKDLDSVQWAFENVTRLDAANVEAWNELGRVRLLLDQPERAAEAFTRSIELDSTVNNLIGIAGLADSYQAQDKVEQSLIHFEKAHQLAPDNPMLCSRIIAGYTSLARFAEASVYGRKLIAIIPEDRDQQRRLGMIFFYADSLDQSKVVFDALMEQGDINPMNHHFLGLIATNNEDHESARDHFQIETEMAGETVESWAALAFAYRNLGQIEQTVFTYRRALGYVATLTDSIQIAYSLGATYEEMDSVDSAVEMFEEVLRWDSTFHQAMNYLGYMLADRNLRLDYSLKLLTKAIEMEPDNTAYLDSYGWVQYRLGNFEVATKYLKRAAELDSDPVMFDHLGDALSALGDEPNARRYWQKALELDPENSAIKEKLKN